MEEKDKKTTQSDEARTTEVPAEVSSLNAAEPTTVTTVTTAEEKKAGEERAAAQTNNGGEEAALQPKKRKRGANIFWNIFLIVVIGFGIFSLFGIVNEIDPQSGSSFGEAMRGASPLNFVILIAVILLIMFCDVSKYCIISKTVTGKISLGVSVKTHFMGKYYDAVTPFSTGGQPMQIYYLNTKGISGGNSSAMVLIRYYSSVMCWIILGGALMIAGTAMGVLDGISGVVYGMSVGKVLKITGWIGIAINMLIPIFVTLFLLLPKLMYKITAGVVKLGHKLKIVKDEQKTAARATKVVSDFKSSFKLMATSPVKLILLILVSFGEVFLTFATPFFVMKAFSCNVDGMLITVMSLNAFATFGVSFIPTPGNSGVVEGMGALAFSAAAGAALSWSVLAWRLSVFYLYILIGLCMTVYDIIMKNVNNRRARLK